MSNVLIPFSKRLSDGQVVGIDEVPNGLACNCVCLSCNAALVAKTNVTTKQAHFAHYKAGSAGEACAITFENSVLWMVSEMLKTPGSFLIPGLYDLQQKPLVKKAARPYQDVAIVTKNMRHLSCLLQIEHNGQKYPLGLTVYFPPDKPSGPLKFDGKEYPHVGINLDILHLTWSTSKGNFTQAVHHLIFEVADTRDWIFHPKSAVPKPPHMPAPALLQTHPCGFTPDELRNLDALAASLGRRRSNGNLVD